jgi:hypothetical protein
MMDLRRHRLTRLAEATCLGLALAVLLLQGRGSAAVSPLQPVTPPPAGKLYHGVYPGGQSGMEDDITAADVQSYEQTVGRRAAWVYFSHNWYAGTQFPLATATWIWQGGAVPFIRLMLREEEDSTPNRFSLEEVLAGTFDSDFRSWAREARAFADPLLVEFGTECNGSWFPWNGLYHGAGTLTGYGDPSKPDGPERFVAAFQRIVTLMREEGASNITWVFHVDATDDPEVAWNRLENYYPGDAFVDWIGVSAYGPQSPTDQDYSSFREQMDPVYARLTALAPDKPVIVAELGCTAGSELIAPEVWAAPAFNDILAGRWPRLIGFAWWNEHWQNDDNPAHDSNMRVQDIPALAALMRTELETDVITLVERPHFTDVPTDSWAYRQIEAAYAAGIVEGYPEGTYGPTIEVTRGQMAVYIARALAGGDADVPAGPATATFTDVPTDYWAYKHVEYAVVRNVVKGYDDGTYRPTVVIARGPMAVFIARAMVAPAGGPAIPDPPVTPTFSDVSGDHWAYKEIEYCVSQGVVQGYDDGTYRPANTVTRDQMAVYVQRAFDLPM